MISSILPKLINLKHSTLLRSDIQVSRGLGCARPSGLLWGLFSMREVAFEDIPGSPLSILEQCRTMKRLLLKGIHFPTNSDSESRFLSISYYTHLSERTTWVNISDLRSLYFQSRVTSAVATSRMLRKFT